MFVSKITMSQGKIKGKSGFVLNFWWCEAVCSVKLENQKKS
jgi:hypothetical protein